MTFWMDWISFIVTIFALVVSVLYMLNPKLEIENDTDGKNIRIKCTNGNRFRHTIKDIKCDIEVSKDDTYKPCKTLKLRKDWITGIEHGKDYTFISRETLDCLKNDGYKHMRVRLLANNFIGVKKYFKNKEEYEL